MQGWSDRSRRHLLRVVTFSNAQGFLKSALISGKPRRDAVSENWDKTDRPFRPARGHTTTRLAPTLPRSSECPRVRWLVENDVYTEYLDAGIGCCWFAYQGAQEPVSGETEDAAIIRLAGESGLELWRDADPEKAAAD